MHASARCLVRNGGLVSRIFGSKEACSAEGERLPREVQDQLRSRLGELGTNETVATPSDLRTTDFSDLLDSRIDADAIRARGVMKYRHKYSPPSDVETTVFAAVEAATGRRAPDTSIQDVGVKFKASDLVDFYATPVQNIDSYKKLARSADLPKNVRVAEEPTRFHPDDREAVHGGVTAFPGTGGKVYGLRNQRILRQFKPKEDWFDYEDQTYDYSRPEKDMPWDPEIAKKMDCYPDRRYALRLKAFTKTL